ncbi:uncharacterized protein LOC130899724 isoform X2 [Diorhabda carinulata]|uniref:uncharacterized protein LOC130899724 isoform X2 n=1 Tax=Diorhabda carinulata TaxID=1163345 RepID=UPI0025A030F9|nr:uncharacterized protein LOC130899724 isoform X2 [Diorhabda carinulata]
MLKTPDKLFIYVPNNKEIQRSSKYEEMINEIKFSKISTFKNLEITVKKINEGIEYFNNGMGKQMLMVVIISFGSILSSFDFILFTSSKLVVLRQVISWMIGNIWLVMFSVIVILSCDRVEKKAEELIKTCIYIQASTGDENALALANLVKELRPKFSAAGFFDINQRILPSFFSNLSTYLIIILQFKLSSL